MPKVTITNAKGLVQETGSGLTVASNSIFNGKSRLNGGLILGNETVTDAGAVSPIIPVSLLVCTTGSPAPALANGATIGQVKHLLCLTAGGTTQDVTPTTTSGAWASLAFTAVGQAATLVWNGAGWALVSRSSGATASATAVVGLPVIG